MLLEEEEGLVEFCLDVIEAVCASCPYLYKNLSR